VVAIVVRVQLGLDQQAVSLDSQARGVVVGPLYLHSLPSLVVVHLQQFLLLDSFPQILGLQAVVIRLILLDLIRYLVLIFQSYLVGCMGALIQGSGPLQLSHVASYAIQI
jgi:hypothetical protein|tara:strand:+ start:1671 stop:2000 length:330 start_codon:yes stop_codon:yes gene_type:complete